MTDKDAPQGRTSRRAHLAAWGAVALVALGSVLGTWTYFRPEGDAGLPLIGLLGAKILTVVLVFGGGALLSLVRGRATDGE
ncbi:hypothetical protein [Streptomyces sp. HNM0574]|uniref:hypothetical protein n=1 Tax=Streptomyces sp. HNM0574 TaxID=2714954 RepID=UPI00146B89BE|nr:hypothetical protein [Streptomyces sp. HNM0574]NLU66767.1 hypothetical protein [Streptomyces sp. HNM0574]